MLIKKLEKLSGAALLVVGARMLLLLAAVALALAGVAVAVRDESKIGAVNDRYYCPMHPEVTATAAGQCPICKMELEPEGKSKASGPNGTESAEHPADCPMHPKRAPTAGATHVCPMHPEITANAPGKCSICKMALVPVREKKLELPAGVVPALASPPAIPHSSSSFATGVTWLPETHPPAERTRPSDRPVTDRPKRRVFVDDVRAPASLESPERLSAVLYRDELIGLSPGERGRFFSARAPRVPVEVRLSDESPTPWDASTSLVRFVVEPTKTAPGNRDADRTLPSPRAGDVGWLELERRPRELLVFPESALLRSSEGPYVLVPDASGKTFTRRPMQIGRILRGHVVVLSGLLESDRIAVSNAFFIDAEQGGERTEPIAGVGP
jgi:hypothetical protein